MTPEPERTYWWATDLDTPEVGSLWSALLRYRPHWSRHRVSQARANLVCSRTRGSRQAPIIDLDVPHTYLPSHTPGRAHLYVNLEIPRWRWWLLMWGLRQGRVIDKGFFWWSLRRGANFARLPGVAKVDTKRPKSRL